MNYNRVLQLGFLFLLTGIISCTTSDGEKHKPDLANYSIKNNSTATSDKPANRNIDTALFNKLQLHLVHDKPNEKWPVKTAYPPPGAILPFKRIVAYYGNFYSKGMGILGELPPDELAQHLQQEVHKWKQADPMIPVLPAIHYIAITAQSRPGKNNTYSLRMPYAQIDKALALANKIGGILFLDVQVGHGRLQDDLPYLEPYLKLPNVHLGIDPEFSMKHGEVPSTIIGTFDAADINYASNYLVQIVRKYNLPPKVMVVHRFTKGMVTNYKNIELRKEVQIVMNMDGFGFPAKKVSSYNLAVRNEPVQFTGFKLFYKNDKLTKPYRLMTPEEVLNLYPSPIYIQYQ